MGPGALRTRVQAQVHKRAEEAVRTCAGSPSLVRRQHPGGCAWRGRLCIWGADRLGLPPGPATYNLNSLVHRMGRRTGARGWWNVPCGAAGAMVTCGLWESLAGDTLAPHRGKSTSRPGGACGPPQVLTRNGNCQAVLLLRPCPAASRCPNSLPIKRESPQTEPEGHTGPLSCPSASTRKRNCGGTSLIRRPLGLG